MNLVGELRWHLGDDCATLAWSEDRAAFSIDQVMVPADARGQGIGTALIERVLMMADTTSKDVFVAARPLGNMSEERLLRLVSYYSRFGFVEIDRGLTVVYMVRRRALQSS